MLSAALGHMATLVSWVRHIGFFNIETIAAQDDLSGTEWSRWILREQKTRYHLLFVFMKLPNYCQTRICHLSSRKPTEFPPRLAAVDPFPRTRVTINDHRRCLERMHEPAMGASNRKRTLRPSLRRVQHAVLANTLATCALGPIKPRRIFYHRRFRTGNVCHAIPSMG